MLTKDPMAFLACRSFLQELFENDHLSEFAEPITTYLGEILHAYEFERSEVVMGTSLDVLSHYVHIWTVGDESNFSELCFNLFFKLKIFL